MDGETRQRLNWVRNDLSDTKSRLEKRIDDLEKEVKDRPKLGCLFVLLIHFAIQTSIVFWVMFYQTSRFRELRPPAPEVESLKGKVP